LGLHAYVVLCDRILRALPLSGGAVSTNDSSLATCYLERDRPDRGACVVAEDAGSGVVDQLDPALGGALFVRFWVKASESTTMQSALR
jgi:hypothetical protein